jgi:GntR family transcriptional regulator, transcriptional repressor for pyruvate dehydrogenase complex
MRRKRDEVIQKLAKWISEPVRTPGDKLPPERLLASQLGVSRSLLREAVITLEALGILEVREKSGIYIKTPKVEDFSGGLKTLSLWPEDILIYLMEMRLLVEAPAAGLAAVRRNETELEQMRECVRKLDEVQHSSDGGVSSGAFWDSLLHTLVVNAAHNPVLTRVYEGLSVTMEKHIIKSRNLLLSLPKMPEKIFAEHKSLVESIEEKDSLKAISSVRHHLEEALEELEKLKLSGKMKI